jgi:hypothetical protein
MDSTGSLAAPTALYTNVASPAANPSSSTPSRPPTGGNSSVGGNRTKYHNKKRNSSHGGGHNGKNNTGGRGGSSGQTTPPRFLTVEPTHYFVQFICLCFYSVQQDCQSYPMRQWT